MARGGRRDLPVAEVRGHEDERPALAMSRLDAGMKNDLHMPAERAIGNGLEVGVLGERRAEAAPDRARDALDLLSRSVRQRDRQIGPEPPMAVQTRPDGAAEPRAHRRRPFGVVAAQHDQNSARASPCMGQSNSRCTGRTGFALLSLRGARAVQLR